MKCFASPKNWHFVQILPLTYINIRTLAISLLVRSHPKHPEYFLSIKPNFLMPHVFDLGELTTNILKKKKSRYPGKTAKPIGI